MNNLNPNNKSEGKMFLAIVLSFFVIFGYPLFMKTFYPQVLDGTPVEEKKDTTGKIETANNSQVKTQTPQTTTTPVFEPRQTISTPSVQDNSFKKKTLSIETLTIKTPLYETTLRNLGAELDKIVLLKHNLEKDSDEKITLGSFNSKGSFGVRLINKSTINMPYYENLPFTLSETGTVKIEEDGEKKVTLTYREVVRDQSGNSYNIVYERVFTFKGNSYDIDITENIRNESPFIFTGALEIDINSDFKDEALQFHEGPLYLDKEKEKAKRIDEDAELIEQTENLKWVALESKYFLLALAPKEHGKYNFTAGVKEDEGSFLTLKKPFEIKPRETFQFDSFVYAGPKFYKGLVKYNNQLEEAVEFGFWSFLAKPFLGIIKMLNTIIGNFGFSIIIFAAFIKVLFYPLSKKSLVSMREMQRLSPQLKIIREKHKDDREKQSREMMEFYKRYKINPFASCLPLLMQIPVFVALYEVLYTSIEFRHEPFIFWITDLSSKDPYYITPVLMGVTMFIQQKMTPTAMDPIQEKVMLTFPIFLTFIMANFPSGLVVYWTCNNVLSIGQQYLINKSVGPAKPATASK